MCMCMCVCVYVCVCVLVCVCIHVCVCMCIIITRSEARFARLLLDCELSYCFHWVIVVVGGRDIVTYDSIYSRSKLVNKLIWLKAT